METIAIISDIHANVVALDAVLFELELIQPNRVVCLGDVAATGPTPSQVIAKLRDRDWTYVRGNCDDNLIRYAAGGGRLAADEHDEIDHWCAGQLSPADLQFLAGFQPFALISVEDVELCCYHGTPGSNLDGIVPATPDDDLEHWFSGHSAVVYAGGHTHEQMVRRFRKSFVINPGSIGLPFTYTPEKREVNPMWAEYGLVRIDGPAVRVELRRTPIDRETVMAVASQSDMPCQSWWTRDWE